MVTIYFIDPAVSAEKSSYYNPNIIKIGLAIPEIYNATGNVLATWEIIGSGLTGSMTITINDPYVPILSGSTAVNFADLGLGVFVLKITTISNTKTYEATSVILNSPIRPIEIDEFFVFGNFTSVLTHGDIRFDSEQRKIKFSNSWKANRTMGNGVIFYNSTYYVFRPRNLFTSRCDLAEFINFSPFDSFPVSPLKIHVIPSVFKLNEFEYLLNHPTSITITYLDKNNQIINKVVGCEKITSIKLTEPFNRVIFNANYRIA